ncbi:uncharacterized [Tachysurus ichikawai]
MVIDFYRCLRHSSLCSSLLVSSGLVHPPPCPAAAIIRRSSGLSPVSFTLAGVTKASSGPAVGLTALGNTALILRQDTAITLHNHSFRGGMDLGPWPTDTNVGLHRPLAYIWASATVHAGHRKQSSSRKRSQDYSAAPNYCRNAVH